MQKRVTLRVDEDVLKRAKEYAAQTDRSLSDIVENYLESLVNNQELDESKLPPGVRNMLGILEGTDLDENAYKRYLIEKYL